MTTYEQSFGRGLWHSLIVIWQSEALLLSNRRDDARRTAEGALALTRELRNRVCEPWALRLLGEIAIHGEVPDYGIAEGHYRQALALAKEIGMPPLVAHGHFGLGKLHRHTGEHEKAREHHVVAATLFREMEMTPWQLQAEVEAEASQA